MKLNKIEVGIRLREFGIKKFGSIKSFAEAIDMPAPSLQSSYLKGRSLPGAPMLAKLLKFGCDLTWLFFGDDSKYESGIISNLQEELQELKQKNNDLEKKIKSLKRIIEK